MFSDPRGWSPSLLDMAINEISSEEADRLEESFLRKKFGQLFWVLTVIRPPVQTVFQ